MFFKKLRLLVFAVLNVSGLTALLSGAQAASGAPGPWQLGLQDAASPVMTNITDFFGMLFAICTAVTIFVLALLLFIIVRFNAKANPVPSKTAHNTILEVVWTLVPVIILLVIVVPSIKLLYYMDRVEEADMTLKVTGYQWYWGYEYQDYDDLALLSYMIPDEEITGVQRRLLETDNKVVLPVDTNIRILVTSADVIHSWAVPAFGIKIDAVPGRLNETWVRIEKEGVYYGQCSELCGTLHAYMPVMIEAVSKEDFTKWVGRAKAEFAEAGGLLPNAGAPFTNNQNINIAYFKEFK